MALRDQVVEDNVGSADGGPGLCIVAVTVQQIKDRIGLFSARVVAWRGIDKIAALVTNHIGLVKMVMDFAVRNVGGFPGERSGTGNVHFVGAIQKVWLGAVVGRIEQADAVGDK